MSLHPILNHLLVGYGNILIQYKIMNNRLIVKKERVDMK